VNWEQEIGIEFGNRVGKQIRLIDLLETLLEELTRDEMEEFGGELIKAAVFREESMNE